jgi:DnaJ-class molecular chaperone
MIDYNIFLLYIMNNDNPYKILNINKTATNNEIKKAFHQLAKKYHPDKITNEEKKKNANDKFIKIYAAYEILSNPETKLQYDNAHDIGKYTMFLNIYNYFVNNPEKFKLCVDNILLFFSKDEKYIYHVNNHDYKTVFALLLNKLFEKNENDNLNITGTIMCKLSDRYYDNYMHIEVERKTKNSIELYVPLRNDTNICYGEGEVDKYGKTGDIILNTITIDDDGYCIENGNMCKTIEIENIPDVYNYQHIDGKEYTVDINEIIEDKYFIIKNIGLLKDDGTRGDFIGEFMSKP